MSSLLQHMKLIINMKLKSSKFFSIPVSDSVSVKVEPKKEKDNKQQMKSPTKATTKKTSNRRSPTKKEKSTESPADVCPPDPVKNQATDLSPEEVKTDEPRLDSSSIPANKAFQRTLSPADVLHVHSYAKGDYAEEEVPTKEEKNGERTDNGTEADSKTVSRFRQCHINTVLIL